ncbi:integrase, catalytic region, zinc finger, CCHC-type containing protein [Tanacetum coccineum]
MDHQTLSVLPIAYHSPPASTQPMVEFPQMDSGLAVPMFTQGDDLISYLNKAMAFLTTTAGLLCNKFKGGKDKAMLVLAIRVMLLVLEETIQEDMQGLLNAIIDKMKDTWRGNAFSLNPGIPDGQAAQKTIPNNAAFQTEDLDTYDYDCDDVSNAKPVLMANLSNYGSDVISEKKANQEKNNESLTAELERSKERVKIYEQRLNIDLSTREKIIDSQMDDMIKEKLALKQQIDSLEQNLSNQIKEKESLLQTFTIFKNESKEKESKYMENEIYLEKKIKELDNTIYKVGQSAQTKAQRIKPTLYDGSVISSQHAIILVIDDEETLILEEIEATVQQCSVDKQCFEILKKELFLKNDRLLQQFMSQDVLLSVMNSTTLNGESVNLEMQRNEYCDKCFDLDVQAKDTTICKLKEHIKSMRENDKEEKVKQDMDEIKTMNIELEHKSKIANNSEPNHSLGSNATDVPSSSSLVNDRFINDQIAKIIAYGDYQLGNVIISMVYYVEDLVHNLFSVRQFCDADLKVAFRKNTCFIRNLEGVDLLLGSRDTNLYTISLDDMLKTSPICLLSKASKTKSWLWHRRLSHLNFGTLNKLAKDGLARGIPKLKFKKDHQCSTCALGKSKKSSHQPKAKDTNQENLYGSLWPDARGEY